MTYCINPDCPQPQNLDDLELCHTCGTKLIAKLRERYRIVQPLGQGGFGKTFLAIDEDRLGTRCVIKQFSPQIKGAKALDKAVQLFEQEAVRLHELGEHPHIPALLAYFEQEQRLYLVQQFVEGSTLAQELGQEGAFNEQKIREILVRLLPILKFVHDRNVIHRDITPSNIIRRKTDGRLVLIDFGIAKVLSESSSGQPGTKIGTEGYAPVEQLRNGKAYPASDLYSLGATCLYLLTQVKPEELYDPLSGRWLWREQLKLRGGGMSEKIGQILDRMLKDLVNDRYQNADEAMHDLRLTLSTPVVGALAGKSELPNGKSAPLSISLPATLPPSEIHFASPKISTPPPPPSLPPSAARSSGVARKSPQPRACLHTLSGHRSWVMSIALSPDRRTLVSGSLDDRILIWDLATGECIGALTGHTNSVNSLAFSVDGRKVISASDDDSIKVWRLSSGEVIRSLRGHSRDVNSIAISEDGTFFVSGSEDRSVCVWHLNTGELLHSFSGLSGMVKAVAVSPNNQMVASGGLNNLIKLWSLVTGQQIRILSGHQNSILSIAMSPQGDRLVSASKDKTIRIWEPNTGELIQILNGHSDSVNAIAISPDGSTLISGSSDKTIKLWNFATAELICTLNEHTHAVNAIAISTDGKWFASGSSDNTIKVWQLSV